MDFTPTMSTDPETGDALLQTSPPPVAQAVGGHFANLAEEGISQSIMDHLCTSLIGSIDEDDGSRDPWRKIIAEAYELLGVGPESKPEDSDDPQADTSDHPLLLTALTRFQARTLSAMLPSGSSAVRAESIIDPKSIEDDQEREAFISQMAAVQERVEAFYTDYLFEKLDSYEADTDQIIYECGLEGMGYRKIVTDMTRPSRPVDMVHVPATDLILSYHSKNVRTGRVTHRMNMDSSELIRRIVTQQYRLVTSLSTEDPNIDVVTEAVDRMVGLASEAGQTNTTHRIYECHCDLVLREDMHPMGLSRPYIVTMHVTSQEILSIVRNWNEGDPDEVRIRHFVPYLYAPGKTATTPLGLGHILSNTTRSLRKAQREGLVSAYLQNHPSGFKLSSFKIRDDNSKIRAGEFIDIDSPTDDIRRALMVQIFQGPSPGLLTMAEKIEANGKELSGLASIDFASLMKSGITPGAVAAAVEESAVFQSAIHRRMYKGLAEELSLLHARMKQVVGSKPVMFGDNGQLQAGDLLKVKLLPMMTPGSSSKQKEVLEAQAVYDLSKEIPDIIDPRTAALQFLRALANPALEDALLPPPGNEPPPPGRDVVTEYGLILKGEPVAADLLQDHVAHIQAHTAQMQGLQVSSLPPDKGMAAMAVLADHIADHMAKQATITVCTQLGIDPQQFAAGLPPQMETLLAPKMAAAVQQMEQARIAQAAPAAPDPIALQKAKDDGAAQLAKLKHDQEKELTDLKAAHALALQAQKNEADMAREEADDQTALEIAAMQNTLKSNAGAGANAGSGAGANAHALANAGSGSGKV
jgi:hypothetical protein